MRLASTISLHAGGEGSGCHGPNCGRKGSPEGHKPDSSTTTARKGLKKYTSEEAKKLSKEQKLRIYQDTSRRAEKELGIKWGLGSVNKIRNRAKEIMREMGIQTK